MVDGIPANQPIRQPVEQSETASAETAKQISSTKNLCIWLDAQNDNNGILETADLDAVRGSRIYQRLPQSVKNFIDNMYLKLVCKLEFRLAEPDISAKLVDTKIDLNQNDLINELNLKACDRKERNNEIVYTEFISAEGNCIKEKIYTFNKEDSSLMSVVEKETIYNDDNSLIEKLTHLDPETGKIRFINESETSENSDGSIHKNITIYQPMKNGSRVKVREASFDYNRETMEEYVINSGYPIARDIKNIKTKDPSTLTTEEQELLEEFNNMMDYVIEAGTEYGVDPNRILAIIQQEVGFDGLGHYENVTGTNGKGYMQLTSSPIGDYLGYYEIHAKDENGKEIKDKNGNPIVIKSGYQNILKDDVYGPEIKGLLLSRGFDPDCSASEKPALKEKIMSYLRTNKDPEFNIQLGTLVLRCKLDQSKGDMSEAALNYNGHPKYKYEYKSNVTNYCNNLRAAGNYQIDSTYVMSYRPDLP